MVNASASSWQPQAAGSPPAAWSRPPSPDLSDSDEQPASARKPNAARRTIERQPRFDMVVASQRVDGAGVGGARGGEGAVAAIRELARPQHETNHARIGGTEELAVVGSELLAHQGSRLVVDPPLGSADGLDGNLAQAAPGGELRAPGARDLVLRRAVVLRAEAAPRDRQRVAVELAAARRGIGGDGLVDAPVVTRPQRLRRAAGNAHQTQRQEQTNRT